MTIQNFRLRAVIAGNAIALGVCSGMSFEEAAKLAFQGVGHQMRFKKTGRIIYDKFLTVALVAGDILKLEEGVSFEEYSRIAWTETDEGESYKPFGYRG